MNKLSFKATFEGMDAPVTKTLFEHRTKNDKKHKIVYTDTGNNTDKFELYNGDKKTAEYETELIIPQLFSVERLLGIYNILKIKEAQNTINSFKKKV